MQKVFEKSEIPEKCINGHKTGKDKKIYTYYSKTNVTFVTTHRI